MFIANWHNLLCGYQWNGLSGLVHSCLWIFLSCIRCQAKHVNLGQNLANTTHLLNPFQMHWMLHSFSCLPLQWGIILSIPCSITLTEINLEACGPSRPIKTPRLKSSVLSAATNLFYYFINAHMHAPQADYLDSNLCGVKISH